MQAWIKIPSSVKKQYQIQTLSLLWNDSEGEGKSNEEWQRINWSGDLIPLETLLQHCSPGVKVLHLGEIGSAQYGQTFDQVLGRGLLHFALRGEKISTPLIDYRAKSPEKG